MLGLTCNQFWMGFLFFFPIRSIIYLKHADKSHSSHTSHHPVTVLTPYSLFWRWWPHWCWTATSFCRNLFSQNICYLLYEFSHNCITSKDDSSFTCLYILFSLFNLLIYFQFSLLNVDHKYISIDVFASTFVFICNEEPNLLMWDL